MAIEYPRVLLKDFLEFFNGKSIKAADEGAYPVYGSNGRIGFAEEHKYRNAIILGRVGAYCGSVEYCPDRFWASDNTIVVKPKVNVAEIRFLYYLLRDLDLHRHAGGAAQPLITQTTLKQVEAPLPPLPTQRKIASILSAYDDLIENNTRRIAILEEMAQAIYWEWFVNFRFPGHENVKLVDSPLGQIPEGWEAVSLSSLMEIKGGTQPPKSVHVYEPTEGYVRLIQIRDYQSDKYPTFVPSSSKLNTCDQRDILIARYGASVARICWGLSGAYNVALAKVLPEKPIYRIFLKEFLMSDFFQQSLIGMSGRAAQNGFNKGDISAIILARPIDDDLLEKFSEIGTPMESAILGLRRKNENLQTTRDLLLPKLISGKLDVEDLDIDVGMIAEALEEATA